MAMLFSRYVSRKYYEENPELKKAIDQIHDGFFSPDDPSRFHDLTYQLLNFDRQVAACVKKLMFGGDSEQRTLYYKENLSTIA